MSDAELERRRKEFCRQLPLMKHRAMELKLWNTMHRLDDAIRMLGFECAGTPELCRKIESVPDSGSQRAS